VLDRWLVDMDVYRTPERSAGDWRKDGCFAHQPARANFVRQDDKRYTAEHWRALDNLRAMLPPHRRDRRRYCFTLDHDLATASPGGLGCGLLLVAFAYPGYMDAECYYAGRLCLAQERLQRAIYLKLFG
jgi:hypothetical protein